jgi:hypothetical protein
MRKLALIGFAAAVLTAQAEARQPAQPGGTAPLASPMSFTQVPQLSPAGSVPLFPLHSTLTPATLPGPLTPPSSPAPPLNENLRTFDPATLELSWANGRWQLTASGFVLKDFGRKEAEGQAALRLARGLRLNQYGTIGSPAVLMEYWLTDGAAPGGPVPGFTTLSFDAASLHVEETLGRWCLRDGRRVLFNFGTRAEDARQALGVLRKYGFNRVAVVGQFSPSMLVFLGGPPGEGDVTMNGRPVRQATSHETPETAARKAEELQRIKERVPGVDADTVVQPAVRPLRTQDQPRLPFSGTVREFGGDGLTPANPSSGADSGDRVAFDWRRVQTRLDGNVWKLAAGGVVLASFGADQDAARRALDAIRYYRFTELHLVGRPTHLFSYFLVGGMPPRGVPLGVPSEPFQPESLKVREIEGKWALCSGDRAVIALGESKDEATGLLEVIRRQRFDLLCRIGKPEDGFTFLARSR